MLLKTTEMVSLENIVARTGGCSLLKSLQLSAIACFPEKLLSLVEIILIATIHPRNPRDVCIKKVMGLSS